jgi:ADP-heptose:LPS heptosyltransferase
MVRSRFRELFETNPDKDGLVPYAGAYHDVFSLSREIGRRSFDLCLVFHDSDPCPVQAAFCAGVPFILRFAFKDESTAPYLSGRISYRDEAHLIEQRLDVLRHLLRVPLDDPDDVRMVLPVERNAVEEYWKRLSGNHGVQRKGEPLIGFQVSAARPYRAWPEERFAELGRRILSEYRDTRIFLFGGPEDAGLGRKIAEEISSGGSVVNLAGKIRLVELPLAMKGLDLLVTNDTGPFHAAVAVGTPTISLFVPSTVRHTGPYQDTDRHTVIRKERPCSPCTEKYCSEPFCMGTIGVGEVYEHVRQSIGRRSDAKAKGS